MWSAERTRQPLPSPQESGAQFEEVIADALGVKPTRGSGNQWFAKMDVATGHVLFSCKWTGSQSFRVEKGHMREIQGHCEGDQEPALAISVGGEVYVVQRAGDWLAGRTKEDSAFIEPSKADIKRLTARVPALLRGEA